MGWGKPFSKKGWGTTLAKIGAVAAGTALGGPLGGAAAGAAVGGMGGGGVKGAATGGLMGGAGGLLMGGLGGLGGAGASGATGATGGGMFSGLGSLFGGGGASSGGGLTSSLGGLFGGGASSGGMTNIGSAMPWLSGGGSALSGGSSGGMFSGLSGLMGGGSGGGSGGMFNMLGSLGSGYMQSNAQKKAEEDMLTGQREARAQIQPYNLSGQAANKSLADKMASGELGGKFNALDLSNDPVYQSELQQGQQAIDRQNSAGSGLYSGAAMKEAAQFSQDLAARKQQEAYNRWLGQQQNTYSQLSDQSAQGINAATGVGNYLNQGGNTRADATKGQSNTMNETIAALLSGSGAIGQKRPTVINGQVVYV